MTGCVVNLTTRDTLSDYAIQVRWYRPETEAGGGRPTGEVRWQGSHARLVLTR